VHCCGEDRINEAGVKNGGGGELADGGERVGGGVGSGSAVEDRGKPAGRKTIRRDFTRGSIPRHLLTFALPVFAGYMLDLFYSIVDAVWVGRFVGSDALAAVAVVAPIIFGFLALVIGMTVATTTMVAQYVGAEDGDMFRRAVGNSLTLLALLGVVMGVAGYVCREPILRLINTPPEVLELAAAYLGIYFLGLPAMFIYDTVRAVLRGLGDSRTPLKFLACATVVNIILDPVLILGLGPLPAMGVAGAALATVLAYALVCGLSLRFLLWSRDLVRLDLSALRLDWRVIRILLVVGLPTGLQQVVISLSRMSVNAVINTFGAVTMAGFGAAQQLEYFANILGLTLGATVTSMVAQNLGARRYDRVRGIAGTAAVASVVAGAMVAGVVLAFPRLLLSMFTVDQAVIAVGREYLMIVAPAFVPFVLMFGIGGVIRGAGDATTAFAFSFISHWVVRVPLAALLAATSLGRRGIWLALALSTVASATMNCVYYVSGRWRSRVVTQRGADSGARTSPPAAPSTALSATGGRAGTTPTGVLPSTVPSASAATSSGARPSTATPADTPPTGS